MENKNNNKGVIALLIVIIVILAVLCVLFATETISLNTKTTNNNEQTTGNNSNTDNQEVEPVEDELGKYDTFSNESGVVEVIGYPETKELTDDMNTGEKYNYVYFHIKETKSDEFKKYIESLKGNSFVLDDAIGLGCIIDNKIKYSNSSNEAKLKEYELSQEDSSKILNATESNPIKLKLERLPLTYGGGAPVCYSHITTIEVED